MLRERIAILERQMLLRLDEIRQKYSHPGNKGANVEVIVRDFLREFLPPTNRIGHGEVIDSHDNISSQIDVIVTNEYHPFLNDLSAPSIFFIEGVACAGEVKSILTLTELESTLEKCCSFKSLQVEKQNGMTVRANPEDIARFVDNRPFFLFAFESQSPIDSIVNRVDEYNRDHKLELTQQIDGIFILGRGYAINFGTGKGAFQFRTPEGKSLPGLIGVLSNGDGEVLYKFLAWYSACTPRVEIPNSLMLTYLIPNSVRDDA